MGGFQEVRGCNGDNELCSSRISVADIFVLGVYGQDHAV